MSSNGGVSRRELLRRVGAAGAAATLSTAVYGQAPEVAADGVLSDERLLTLEAATARIIPTDDNGPGAAEARAARFIDRALAGELSALAAAYEAGLDALDAHARAAGGTAFAELPPDAQDNVLRDFERDAVPGVTGGAAAFFAMLREHTIQGTFSDPHYGGNAGFVGWDLIGYPGVRTGVSAEQQRMGVTVEPSRRSAYDIGMFQPRGR